MLGAIQRMQDDTKVKPNILLEQSEHETIKNAYIVDKSDVLNYKANLNFDAIERDLITLWGRMDKVRSWKGLLHAELDSRLEFDSEIEVVFRSTWLKPDYDKLQQYSVTNVDNIGNHKWRFTVPKEHVKTHITTEEQPDPQTNRKYSFYSFEIPVTLIPREEFIRLPFNATDYDGSKSITPSFMEPMILSVADSYEEGLNTIITHESFNKIATSDNPFVKAKGQIHLEIVGETPLGTQKFDLFPKANPEYAKFYPTGKVTYRYFDIEDQTKPLLDNNGKNTVDIFGRALNNATDVQDSNNYSEKYTITSPTTTVDDHNNTYRFVTVKDNKSLSGDYDHKENKVIDLLYVKNDKGVIIVDHVDEEGNFLASREYKVDSLSKVYSTHSQKFDTWYFKEVAKKSDSVKGVFSTNTKHIVFVYTKNKPKDNDNIPNTPNTPVVNNNTPNQPVTPERPVTLVKKALSNTGVENNLMIISGIFAILGAGLLSLKSHSVRK